MTEPQDVLADLLRRLDGWAGDAATRYERADEMVDVARRELRAVLVRTNAGYDDAYEHARTPETETLDAQSPTPPEGLRAAVALIAADWFDTGYENGRLDHGVLADRLFAALAASPAPDPGAGAGPCLNCNGTGFYMLDGSRRPCLWDHGPEQRPVGVFDFGEQSRRWLVDKHGEATVVDFEYAVVRALERVPLREAAQRVIAWADHHEPWNPSGDFDALRAALTPSAEPPETT